MSTTVHYLRTGRKLRASGTVVTTDAGLTKVKPVRDGWGHVWLTKAEMEAGKEKPEYRPREKRHNDDILPPKKPRKNIPKPATVPRWKQLVDQVRMMEIDHVPDGWPAVKMRTLTDLADELQSARRQLAELLPMQLP